MLLALSCISLAVLPLLGMVNEEFRVSKAGGSGTRTRKLSAPKFILSQQGTDLLDAGIALKHAFTRRRRWRVHMVRWFVPVVLRVAAAADAQPVDKITEPSLGELPLGLVICNMHTKCRMVSTLHSTYGVHTDTIAEHTVPGMIDDVCNHPRLFLGPSGSHRLA